MEVILFEKHSVAFRQHQLCILGSNIKTKNKLRGSTDI